MKINLGCGTDIKDGYLNIDLHNKDPRVKIANVLDLNFIESNSVEVVHAQDVLEHFCMTDAKKALVEWARVLKPGGTIYIQTINIDKQLEAYSSGVWSNEDFCFMVFAGINWQGGPVQDADYHKCAPSYDVIRKVLSENNVLIKKVEYDEIDAQLRAIPRSHNLNMTIWGEKL